MDRRQFLFGFFPMTSYVKGQILTADELNSSLGEKAASADLANNANGLGVDLVANAIKKVANIPALRALRVPQGTDAQTVMVDGVSVAGSGFGSFTWSASSTATDDGATVINPTGNTGAGRWIRQMQFVCVLDFGARGDGSTDDSVAFINAKNALPNGGYIFVPMPSAYYSVAHEILIDKDYIHVVGASRSVKIGAGVNNINLVHWAGSYGGMENLTLSGNPNKSAFTGIDGLRITPADETQTTTVVNQNYNTFRNLNIDSCVEAMVMACGPTVSGADSGCWYNRFHDVLITYSTRGVWLKDSAQSGHAGNNRNQFYGVRVGQSVNTGLQIDAGDTNTFYGCNFEGVNTGASPNATPTGVKIIQTSASGYDNNDNRFYGITFESCTRDIENNNTRTQFYGHNAQNCLLTALPAVFISSDPATQPFLVPGMLYQANGQVSGYYNLTTHLLGQNGAMIENTGMYGTRQDPDTGTHFPAEDVIAWKTNGTDQAEIDGTGLYTVLSGLWKNKRQTAATGPGGSNSNFNFAYPYDTTAMYLVARGSFVNGTIYAMRLSWFVETASGTFVEAARIFDSTTNGGITAYTESVTRSGNNIVVSVQATLAGDYFTNWAAVTSLA